MLLHQDLFTTNKPPNNEELSRARDVIKATHARLEIVQKMLAPLKEEEQMLLQTLKAYQPVVSPLRRAPDDVVNAILLACTDVLPKVDINVAPLLFMRISQRFRRLALNLPKLWAAISIDADLAFESVPTVFRSEKNYLDLISQWLLVRSAAMPLNIVVIGFIVDDPIFTHASEHGLLSILFQCKPRWQDIAVDLEDDKPVAQFIAQVNETGTDFPHLRSLSIKFDSNSERKYNFNGDGLLLAPNLARLYLYTPRPFMLNPAPLKWTKLTFLQISGSVNTLGPVLRQASSTIVDLHVNCLRTDITGAEEYVAGIIRFPSLRKLVVEDWNANMQFIHAMVDLIDPPLLKTLTLESWYHMNEQCLSSLLSRIRHLEIFIVDAISLEVLPRILRQTPALRELYINEFGSFASATQDAFLDAFVAEGNGRICPNLQVLD